MALAMARETRMPSNDTGDPTVRDHIRLRPGTYVDSQGGGTAGTRAAKLAIDSLRFRIPDTRWIFFGGNRQGCPGRR